MPFRQVVGHHRLIDLLKRSVGGGTLPPSLLFTGPSGVGKRLTAIAVAQTLNCQRQTTDASRLTTDACGECAACRRIARGAHPDVLVVEPGDTGTIKIDQIRDVVDRANYRPFEGRRRVVVIDEADALVVPAQNALLKTLEEPPPSSVFILVTARPDALLATVRSRCPVLRFLPLEPEEVTAVLARHGRSDKDARAIAAGANGSVAQALEARNSDVAAARDVAARVLSQAASTDEPRRRIDAAKDLLVKTGGGGAGDREQLASHLRAMASLLRDVELLGT